jgi:hypothetical protein
MPQAKKKNPQGVRTPTKTKKAFYYPNEILEAVRKMAESQTIAATDTAVIMTALREYLAKHGFLKK